MEYRRTSLVINRQQQAPQNSHIYASFAPPNRNTNGSLFDSPTMWWDEERIEATVNRQFVLAKLRPDEQARLDQPLGFGDGLTDDTYMEWIETKAKRIFLILVDLGVPDQIFGVIDDSWDDDDLPVPLDQVERLQLTYDRDEKLERKFFQRQFIYLLRNIQRGEHVSYNDEEVVPLESAEKRPVSVTGLTVGNVDRVHLPGRPDDIFIRRRIPLGVTPGRLPQEEFLSGIEAMKSIEHDHLMSLWASYSYQGCGFLLLTPVNDSSLKSFLAVTPQSVKILAKQDRRILLLNWMHCLADAVSFLHGQGVAHRSIRPSNVMLDLDNHIFLGDSGIFPTANLSGEKQGFDKEVYDYAAPEQTPRPPPAPVVSLPVSRPSTARRATAPSTGTTFAVTSHATHTSYSTFPDTASIYTNSTGSGSSNSPPKHGFSGSKHDPQKSDIFSLGAMFLEILTFFLKRTSRNFASHRAAKNKTPGRGGGLPDSSFHKNLGQVESWIATLKKDSSKKEDKVFRGVTKILELTERMMKADPEERPLATEVEDILYNIMNEQCGLGQTSDKSSSIHCENRNVETNEWNFGFDQLRLASQRAAAEACASVNPVTANGGTLGLNGGVIYGIERTQSVMSNAWPTSPTSPTSPVKERLPTRDGSIATSKSRSSEGKSRQGSTSQGSGNTHGKTKPKAKAWQAPVYAEMSWG
ncbi:kinase-like protein [Mollisia scopiformis]|uniref:Kinase-like protein n=1 Tax=Mollisia scopiformis TaxID=149040 RepID=A0A194X517_MOLSC|nr:kinase-like protein [Mollisia scopiformis]KUJ15273.1 kinase-like protein [Mollisia scopiformis]